MNAGSKSRLNVRKFPNGGCFDSIIQVLMLVSGTSHGIYLQNQRLYRNLWTCVVWGGGLGSSAGSLYQFGDDTPPPPPLLPLRRDISSGVVKGGQTVIHNNPSLCWRPTTTPSFPSSPPLELGPWTFTIWMDSRVSWYRYFNSGKKPSGEKSRVDVYYLRWTVC